jgi:nucleoid-associated protein YgaU
MDTLKNIWKQLWENKPILITLVVFLGVLIYFAWQSIQANNQPSQAILSPQATMPEGQAPSIIVQPAPVTTHPPPPNVLFPVYNGPRVQSPSGVGGQPLPQRTVTVTPWPTQNSTLWGIAQSVYGNGAKWPQIYAANRAKIGNNPNLIFAGTQLVIP